MTKEQERISELNKQKAWDYFVSIGAIPKDAKKYSYNLHHIDPSWRHNDVERYIQWNIPDLIPMTTSEHTKLHWKLDYEGRCNSLKGHGHSCSEETKNKISESLKGNIPWNKGLKGAQIMSDETKMKISEANKDKVGELNGFYGKQHSEEWKKTHSDTMKGFKHTDESKKLMSEKAKGRHKGMHWKLVDGKRVWY